MEFIKNILSYINNLELKKIYQTIGITVGIVFVLMGVSLFYYYSAVNSSKKKIAAINDLREEVRLVLDKAEQVQQQRNEVNAMLSQDPNFKIGGYFKDVLLKLHLTEKSKKFLTEPIEREDNYRETRLNAEFVDMTMKELTELLDTIEQNQRVYTKELDISRSKKTPHTINVKLVIGTLQPKTAESE
jgi:hypothetical protein